MLTKSNFRDILNHQRTNLLGAACMLDSLPLSEEKKKYFSEVLRSVWLSGDIIAAGIGIELKSADDIIKIGEEILELEKMYNQE